MNERTLSASVFKARCLGLLDDVAHSHTSIVITKHGKAVARLVPMDEATRSTMGSVTLLASDDDSYFTTGETWDAEA